MVTSVSTGMCVRLLEWWWGEDLPLSFKFFLLLHLKLSNAWRDLLGYYLSALESTSYGRSGAVKCSSSAGRQEGKVERAPGLEENAIGSEPEFSHLAISYVTLGKSFCLVIIPTM